MSEHFTKQDAENLKKDMLDEIEGRFNRHTGILLEEFQKNLGFVIDQQQDIKRELNQKIDSTVGELRKELRMDTKSLREDTKSLREDTKSIHKEIQLLREEVIAHRDSTEVHVKQARRPREIK